MPKLILIVDDEESIRQSLEGILCDEGYQVVAAENGEEALDMIREEVPDLVLLDIWMPGMDGIQALERIKAMLPEQTVVMMSGHGTIETAVKATRVGAFDFIEKPFSLDKLLITIANAISIKELRKENEALRLAALKDYKLVGVSEAVQELQATIIKLAPASTPVMLYGEDGVGKELVARAIHHHSSRNRRPFVAVNCLAIPARLLGTELFGYEQPDGSGQQKRGRLDLADGGSLFLDGINELPLMAQGELVRVLTDQSFERIGSSRQVRVNIRLIAASNSQLHPLVKSGQFRADLYQLLQVMPLNVATLRDRSDDIPTLVKHFVQQFKLREGWEGKEFDKSALQHLKNYHWPGNIRELKNIVERTLIMAAGPVVTVADLPEFCTDKSMSMAEADNTESYNESHRARGRSLADARECFERDYIMQILQQSGWEIDLAAGSLGLERTVLLRRIKQYGLMPE